MIRYGGALMEVLPGETVLDCLERHGIVVPFSCRSGVCQTCVLRAAAGRVPAAAQVGLRRAWREDGYFLPCVCLPAEDLVVESCVVVPTLPSRIVRTRKLSPSVFGVWLKKPERFEFRAGQFVHLVRPEDDLMRPYSIASLPEEPEIELHVALLAGGRMSGWITRADGFRVLVSGPFGECCYIGSDPEQPIVLAGTGTGLSPLLGVLKDALASGHRGPIRLYHGARDVAGLYAASLLRQLERRHANLTVIFSVLEAHREASTPHRIRQQPLEEALFGDGPNLSGHRLYFCGNPRVVHRLRKRAYLAGASLTDIHLDPFVPALSSEPGAVRLAVSGHD